MSDRFRILCHSERSEESRPGFPGAVCLTQSKIPRFARNDISWFPSARQRGTRATAHGPFRTLKARFENEQAQDTPRSTEEYKNRGNEAKKYLKIKDFTF